MCSKYLYWAPRVLAILFIAFLSIFALDVFGEGYGFLELLIALFMHLIPALILVGVLWVAWRREKVGGIIFVIIGFLFTIFFRTYSNLIGFLLISFPVFLIGFLFWINKPEVKKGTETKKIKAKKKAGKVKRKKKKK